MPYKPKHPCAQPGCAALTNARYCEAHARQAHRDYNQHRRRPGSNQSYGRQWRAIRDLYISAHPLCEQCIDAGRITPAQEVHHILPLSQGGDHREDNLQALCKSCHSSVTMTEMNRAMR